MTPSERGDGGFGADRRTRWMAWRSGHAAKVTVLGPAASAHGSLRIFAEVADSLGERVTPIFEEAATTVGVTEWRLGVIRATRIRFGQRGISPGAIHVRVRLEEDAPAQPS